MMATIITVEHVGINLDPRKHINKKAIKSNLLGFYRQLLKIITIYSN